MKFTVLVLSLAVGSVSAFTTRPSTTFRPTTTSTSLEAHENGLFKAMAAGFAGLTLASQMAFGAPLISNVDTPQLIVHTEQASSASSSAFLLGAFGAPSGGGGASFDTMDFSMPSYGDATKSESVKSSAPPAFSNPFPDLALPRTEEPTQSADEAKKAAAEAKQAAADAKEAAAAKKAEEKAARRAAEIEKQKEAVARSMAEKVDVPAPAVVAPAVVVPEFKAPEFKAPEFKAPEFKAPEFKAPEFKAPEMPKFTVPDSPKFDAPKFDSFKAPEMPKFTVPDTPKFDSFKAPGMPKFSVPSFDVPEVKAPAVQQFSSPSKAVDIVDEEDVAPQEVRDDLARQARSVFLSFDNDAKELEAKARELRKLAGEKEELAKKAKDEACKTHWGGKILCLRPLNSGY